MGRGEQCTSFDCIGIGTQHRAGQLHFKNKSVGAT